MTTHGSTPEHQQRLGDEIIRSYRERISGGVIPAGERLPSEGAICEEFNASRTVVREALQQLRAFGLRFDTGHVCLRLMPRLIRSLPLRQAR